MIPGKIKALRLEAGLTQTQLASRMGLGKAAQITVSRWETGAAKITKSHALLLELICSNADKT